jgi:hypothetical protein
MGHQQGFRAAVIGRRLVNNAPRTSGIFAGVRGLIRGSILGAVAILAASAFSTPSQAQSGPFNGLAGVWSGAGSVTLDDGSSERIRCKATYAVGEGGRGLNQTLTCASDSYKFDFRTNVIAAEGNEVTGSWSEISRNISGTIQGRSGNGLIQVTASAAGFSANIAVSTHGNRQSVSIKSEGAFKSATINLARS